MERCRKDFENLTLLYKTPFRRCFDIVLTFKRILPILNTGVVNFKNVANGGTHSSPCVILFCPLQVSLKTENFFFFKADTSSSKASMMRRRFRCRRVVETLLPMSRWRWWIVPQWQPQYTWISTGAQSIEDSAIYLSFFSKHSSTIQLLVNKRLHSGVILNQKCAKKSTYVHNFILLKNDAIKYHRRIPRIWIICLLSGDF